MGAVVVTVDQTGLGRRRHLVEQRGGGKAVDARGVGGKQAFCQQPRHRGREFFKTVQPPRGAAAPRRAADETAALFFARELAPARRDHVHVKETAHRVLLLDACADRLDCFGRRIDRAKIFISRYGVQRFGGQACDPGRVQRPFQLPQPLVEAAAVKGAVLHRAGNVHRKGNKGQSPLGKEPALRLGPPVAGFEHLGKCDFSHQ